MDSVSQATVQPLKTAAEHQVKVEPKVAEKIVQTPAELPKYIPIGHGKYVKVCNYRQKPYINIRDYTTTSEGRLYSTKRGILLSPAEWKQLKKSMKEVDQEVKKL